MANTNESIGTGSRYKKGICEFQDENIRYIEIREFDLPSKNMRTLDMQYDKSTYAEHYVRRMDYLYRRIL